MAQDLLVAEALPGEGPSGAAALQRAAGSPGSGVKSWQGLAAAGAACSLQHPPVTDGDVIGSGLTLCVHKAKMKSPGGVLQSSSPAWPGVQGA